MKTTYPCYDLRGASVAMGNGKPNIKEAARYVTTDNNHHGVAKAIYSAIAYNNELLKKVIIPQIRILPVKNVNFSNLDCVRYV